MLGVYRWPRIDWRKVTMSKIQKVNYVGKMWARLTGSLLCIDNFEKTGLPTEITLLRHLRPSLRQDSLQNAWFSTTISFLVTFAFSI